MKTIDLIIGFELEINKLDDSLNKPFTDDSLYWLNQAVVKFVKDRFNGNAPKRTSYEQNEKRTRDLINLLKTTNLQVDQIRTPVYGYTQNSRLYETVKSNWSDEAGTGFKFGDEFFHRLYDYNKSYAENPYLTIRYDNKNTNAVQEPLRYSLLDSNGKFINYSHNNVKLPYRITAQDIADFKDYDASNVLIWGVDNSAYSSLNLPVVLDDLLEIHIVNENVLLSVSYSDKIANYHNYNSYEYTYPEDMMFMLNEDVDICDNDGNYKMNTCVFECTADNFMYRINNSLTDFHYKHHRARPLRIRTSDGCLLLTDKNYKISRFSIGYIKTPTEITNESPDTDYTDFPEYIWPEIIKIAALMYVENQADPRYRTLTNEVLTQE